MPIRVRILLTCVLAVAVAGPRAAAPSAQAPDRRIDSLYKAYKGGDFGVIARILHTSADYDAIHRDLQGSMARWERVWEPVDATFLLDLFIVKLQNDRSNSNLDLHETLGLLNEVRDFVRNRPTRPGVSLTEDAFELHWHRTLLALLQKRLMAWAADAYLKTLAVRIGPLVRKTTDLPPLVDPHLALASAIVKEQWLTADTVARLKGAPIALLTLGWPLSGTVKDSFDEAIRRFDLAAKDPSTAAEAAVRKGFLLYRTRRFEDALATLDAASERTSDPVVLYWGRLFRGMTLESLGRSGEARAAYLKAREAWPAAPTPAISLAALQLRDGQREDAIHWAEVARTGPADATDPWWTYWYGDGRFFDQWLADLRREAVK